jgi:hypothetical protein
VAYTKLCYRKNCCRERNVKETHSSRKINEKLVECRPRVSRRIEVKAKSGSINTDQGGSYPRFSNKFCGLSSRRTV